MLFLSPPFITDQNLQYPTFNQWFLLILTGVFTLLTWFFINQALKYEEASKIMPLNYCGLVFTGIFDKIFFNYFPTFSSIVGIVLIAGSCIFLVLAKRKEELSKPTKRGKRVSQANIS
eukprot:TRINITY_DN1222_c0_g1_i2.p1 TRINITY_DN1222_c0_g1~~TRINITY_DN1222_c0_g1_i2.p1  ORF type:complete len:118 (+),score=13.32 TRINITY_DN1222_c0_g1_i2:174-527(+)